MSSDFIDVLLRRERRLDRSFASCALLFVAFGLFTLTFIGRSVPTAVSALVSLLLLVALIASYVWFAAEVTLASRALGKSPALWLLWMVVAPLLALLPIPVVTRVIEASPLCLKFILSNELRAAIRERTLG